MPHSTTPPRSESARDRLLAMGDDDRYTTDYDISTAEFAWPIGTPTCKVKGQGLYEICSNLAGNRMSCVFWIPDRRMVQLHGIVKKIQTTRKADLDIACRRVEEVSP